MKQKCLLVYLVVVLASLVVLVHTQSSINFNVQLNEKQHHTSDYKVRNNVPPNDDSRMIVRRGLPFIIQSPSKTAYKSFTLVPFNPLSLQKESNTISIPVVASRTDPTTWQAVSSSTSSGTQYTVYSPATSNVGIFYWQLNDPSGGQKLLDNELVVLFNPWNSDDEVYYANQAELSEYVQNTQTLLWVGSTSSPSKVGWVYDQYHYSVLEVTLYFISQLSFQSRGSAALVSRHLSAWVNVNDEGGLIWGKWSEPYSDGKTPTYWTGSMEIFQQYRETQEAVKYGQCWVFGACLTSAARTLGIPSRTITNFDSAHENQGTGKIKYAMKIDMFFDSNGEYLGMEGGSVWNFHVWCEFFFTRKDLSNGDGWQAVDGTPQELSAGFFQMGPAPLSAVKSQSIATNYDVDFVTSEVGASIYQWAKYDTGNQKNPKHPGFWLLSVEKDGTGHMISTKAVGQMSRLDITSLYKSANSQFKGYSVGKDLHEDENVTFSIDAPPFVNVGDNITLYVVALCQTCGPLTDLMLQIAVDIRMISYIGEDIAVIEKNVVNISLSGPETIQQFVVPREDYQNFLGMNRLIEYNIFIKYFSGGNFTGDYASKQGRVAFTTPSLILTPLSPPSNSSVLHLDALWRNPLTIDLTNVILRLSGAYIAEEDIWIGTVHPNGLVQVEDFEVTYWTPPGTEITVFGKLLIDQLSPVNGRVDLPN